MEGALGAACSFFDWHKNDANNAACLFQYRNVSDTFFHADSKILAYAKAVLFGNQPVIDTNFQLCNRLHTHHTTNKNKNKNKYMTNTTSLSLSLSLSLSSLLC
jgi:hypothetical protein